jgi:hypothetical protein
MALPALGFIQKLEDKLEDAYRYALQAQGSCN